MYVYIMLFQELKFYLFRFVPSLPWGTHTHICLRKNCFPIMLMGDRDMGFIVEAFVIPFICVLGLVGILPHFLLYANKVKLLLFG